jgi:Ca2+-binding RTX toxin-like protein
VLLLCGAGEMATYDMARIQVLDDLGPAVDDYLAGRIWTAVGPGMGGRSTSASGSGVGPANANTLVVGPGATGPISIPADVTAVTFTGSAGSQVELSLEASLAVRMGAGADVVRVTELPDGQAGAVVRVDLGAGDDAFVGSDGMPNHVLGGSGDDRMIGGNGNDRFGVGEGSDTVDGGAGYDRAFVHGRIDDYAAAIHADGSLSLTNKMSGEVTTLTDLEFLTFDDGAVMLNVGTETGFAAASLYEVILGRGADAAVHEHFSGADGAGLVEAANGLLASAEFTGKFGPVSDLSDTAFLEILYATAFEREPEAEGLQYWLDRLASGTSRGEVAVQFASSAEAHAEFAATINIIDKDHLG